MSEARTLFPLGDGIGRVTLLQWMGDDAGTVERARGSTDSSSRATPQRDRKLLRKLLGDLNQSMHGSVVRGRIWMVFDVVLPLISMRQWVRHLVGHQYVGVDVWTLDGNEDVQVAGNFVERSLRYVRYDDDRQAAFYHPPRDRVPRMSDEVYGMWLERQREALGCYRDLLEAGWPPELARCFLPHSIYTQMEWTVNLQGVLHWGAERWPGRGAQHELASYAPAVFRLIERNIAPEAIRGYMDQNGLKYPEETHGRG